jgi:hypothetical protein
MTYTPYLIAKFATGLDKSLQPWLIPDDAQEQLLDGYVYRGTMSKRDGYKYFATGERGGTPYRESRIVHTLTAVAPSTGVIDGTNATFTFAGTGQIARGSVVVTGSNPAQVLTDNGVGGFTGPGTGMINYTTGAISVTFTTPPIVASTVLLTYSFMPGNPVMMIANYITDLNVKELIVADTQYVNRYNSTLNILQDITATPYTGNKFQFFTWVNYASATSTPRLLFSNNQDPIQQYDGTAITNYAYTLTGVAVLTCSYMVNMKDRLILLRTTEDGTIFPKRIRISGTGANSDVFDSSATGAGFIDIPDGTWIQGASFNRDDLIIFTETSTWVLKYTGNDTTPFVLDKIDESRGSDATFSAITYLNRTSAASKRGLIISDGYRVERQDTLLPDFSFNEVDGTNFALCFAGSVDADRDHYLIYPPAGQEISKRILITNYEEDNYATYRLPLSCMGNYITSFTITWNDLLSYPNWDALAADYGDWNSFAYNSGAPFSVGGGHKGEIWKLSVTESEDNPVRIYNITVIDSVTIEVTTDWNNYSLNLDDQTLEADSIFFTGIVGMQEINDQQFPIVSITNNNVFRVDVSTAVVSATSFGAYVSGGRAQRVIPFSSLFKKFNPYVNQDRKVRCGWLYMYVDSSGTLLKRNLVIDDIDNTNPCIIHTEIDHNLHNGDQVSFFGIGGTTQLNGTQAFITVIDKLSFSLNGVDAMAFGVYTSGGYARVSEPAKMTIDIIANDDGHKTQVQNLSQDPYQGNMTNMVFEDGNKKWYKVFINQTGKFIQFRLRNRQAGAKVNIQATMPGFQPVGRLI